MILLLCKDLFFKKSYNFLEEYFGKENIHGGFVHKDEVHEYRDSRVRDADDRQAIKESMEHMHVMVSPYTAEKGINSKAFNTKAMFKNIQKEFDEMVYREFGVHYHTKEQALGLKVEELKEATELIVQKEQQLHQLERDVNQLEQKHNLLLQVPVDPRSKKVKEVEPVEKGLPGMKEKFVPYEEYKKACSINNQLLKDKTTLANQNNVLQARNSALESELKEIKAIDLFKENKALKSKLEGANQTIATKDQELDKANRQVYSLKEFMKAVVTAFRIIEKRFDVNLDFIREQLRLPVEHLTKEQQLEKEYKHLEEELSTAPNKMEFLRSGKAKRMAEIKNQLTSMNKTNEHERDEEEHYHYHGMSL